ncbi:hypothetical protein ACSBR1_038391 [Camellia fascicularis]
MSGAIELKPVAWPSRLAHKPYYSSGTASTNPSESGSQLVFNQLADIYIVRANGSTVKFLWPNNVPNPNYANNYHRATLDFDGVFRQYTYSKTSVNNQSWSIVRYITDNICMNLTNGIGYGACGFNSYCVENSGIPSCQCPLGFSFTDPNNKFGGCQPNFLIGCGVDDGSRKPEDLYALKVISDMNWPSGDYDSLQPYNQTQCEQSCLHDCSCAVAMFHGSTTCRKKRLPLSNGRKEGAIAIIKVGCLYFKTCVAQIFAFSLERASQFCFSARAAILELKRDSSTLSISFCKSEILEVCIGRSNFHFYARAGTFVYRTSKNIDWVYGFLKVLLEEHLITAVSNWNSSNAAGQLLSRKEIRCQDVDVDVVVVGMILLWSILFGSSGLFNVLLLVIDFLVVFSQHHKKSKKTIYDSNVLETNLRIFTFDELNEATQGFKEELGMGSFGIVYKGALKFGSKNQVVVKRLDKLSKEGEREFKTEVSAIGKTHHKNLIQLVGYCNEGPQRLLIYEPMTNGSLADFLFSLPRPSCLSQNPCSYLFLCQVSHVSEGARPDPGCHESNWEIFWLGGRAAHAGAWAVRAERGPYVRKVKPHVGRRGELSRMHSALYARAEGGVRVSAARARGFSLSYIYILASYVVVGTPPCWVEVALQQFAPSGTKFGD